MFLLCRREEKPWDPWSVLSPNGPLGGSLSHFQGCFHLEGVDPLFKTKIRPEELRVLEDE